MSNNDTSLKEKFPVLRINKIASDLTRNISKENNNFSATLKNAVLKFETVREVGQEAHSLAIDDAKESLNDLYRTKLFRVQATRHVLGLFEEKYQAELSIIGVEPQYFTPEKEGKARESSPSSSTNHRQRGTNRQP